MPSDFLGLMGTLTAMASLEMQQGYGPLLTIADEMGKAIMQDAQDRLGHLQDGWDPLKDVTRQRRVELGFTENDPLLRSGQLRDDITYSVEQGDGQVDLYVGIPSNAVSAPYAASMELGDPTSNVPARPFLLPAAMDQRRALRDMMVGVFQTRTAYSFPRGGGADPGAYFDI